MDEILKPLEMILGNEAVIGSLKIGIALVANGIATSSGLKDYISEAVENFHDCMYYSWVVGK